MSKLKLLFFIVALTLGPIVNAAKESNDNARATSVERSGPQTTIEDLYKILEFRMSPKKSTNNKEYKIELPEKVEGKDVKIIIDNSKVDPNKAIKVVVNPRNRSSLDEESLMIVGAAQAKEDIKKIESELANGSASKNDHKEIKEKNDLLQEIRRELENLRNVRAALTKKSNTEKKLSSFEEDEQYYRSLLQRQSKKKRKPEKRFLLSSGGACSDNMSKKIQRIHAQKLLRIEKSRITADRVAELALNSIKRKQRIMECLGLCGCNGGSDGDSVDLVVVDEAGKKRDVELSTSSVAASSLDATVGAGGVSVDSSLNKATSSDVTIDTPLGSSSTSISSSVSSDVHIDKGGLGIDAGLSLGLGLGSTKGGLYKYLTTCEEYERKMIMDMSIEDAAAMIRRVAYDTRGGCGVCDEDPHFERKCLKLAIELVNKVTYDPMSKIDLLSKCRYRSVDDYLKHSLYRGESTVSDDYYGDLYDSYANPYSFQPLCCSEYEIAMGHGCPECTRRHLMTYRYK